jgi:ketosteroid isomerase-like protein
MTESGDLAAAWGLYTITAQPVGGGDPLVMQGRYLDVARNFDGRWLYIADHASVPLPAQQ